MKENRETIRDRVVRGQRELYKLICLRYKGNSIAYTKIGRHEFSEFSWEMLFVIDVYKSFS